jgi:hypothetical protein
MRGHFRYVRFKTFSVTPRTPQCKVFWALLSNPKHSGVPEDSKSPTLGVLGFTPTLGQSGVVTLLGSNIFIAPMVGKGWIPMMLCKMPLRLLRRMHDFTFYVNRPMFFHYPFFSLYINESTLWFQWMASKHWLTSSSNKYGFNGIS